MVPDASSSMDLKLRELLREVRLDDPTLEAIDRAVSSITDAIESIPDQDVIAEAAPGFVRDLRVPSDKVAFVFNTPEVVRVTGSHSFGCVTKPDINVDLLVRMPKECFHEKDYLNHRYHAKRCLYLCVIERSLKSLPSVRKIKWASFQNEARKPVLLVFPVTKLAELSEFHIRVIPDSTSVFDVGKLSLTRNNVRAFNQGGVTMATPKYNSSILEDMFLVENAEFVKKAFQDWKSLEEAFVLLKVWARQRSSIFTHDCLNGYLISVIMSFLTVESGGNIINKSMTVMQIFRVTMKFIATSNIWEKGLVLQPTERHSFSKEDMGQYMQSFDVVMIDASGHLNLSFRMTRAALLELQDEAACSLKSIDKCRDGGFEEVFMTKVDFASKFDSCLRVNLKANARVYASDFCLDEECWRVCEKDMHSLLQQGLTDRAKLIRVTWRITPSEWSVYDGFSKFGDEQILAGILFSSEEKIFRVVDIGPNPEKKDEAIKFRKFWGEKAELRRFKDGTIAESTVWECEPWQRHLIIKRITEYLLSKHFLLQKEDITHIVDQLDFSLHLGSKDPVLFSGLILGAFEVLSKRLRLLEEIPLRISSVQPLHPVFRHASVFPPEPHILAYEKNSDRNLPDFVASCIQPLEVMIQLEGSGNWPLDNIAVEKTKSAFLLKIGESLQERWGMFCTASEDEVIVFSSGYSFSLKILHDKGLDMLKTQAGNVKVKATPSVDKELFLRSQHSSMINGLHGRYPMYGPVVRLAKRWVSAHLFSSFLVEEAIELVVAYLFLKPFPYHPPCSRINGFLRFLRLLSNYDWTFSPLIVDINDDFSSKDEKEINENFILSRKSYKENSHDVERAMFLATSYDKGSEAWTKYSPSKVVLKRMASYARSSASILTNLILQNRSGSHTWESLFRTPLNNYDAIIHLHREKLSHPQHLLFPAENNCGKLVVCGKPSKDFQPFMPLWGSVKSLEDARDKLMVSFDPTRCFLGDLKREFPDIFNVWYDSLGGDAIGLTWEKKAVKKRSRDEADEIRIEPLDILKEVGEVGKGLVKSVFLLKAPKLDK
ncbi:uncharacterized protein [Typha latifolia]|uniref:uncharacterized protein n=1 Tax=Typha latifolia TaxID=4733 RepID=UPI003C2CAF70